VLNISRALALGAAAVLTLAACTPGEASTSPSASASPSESTAATRPAGDLTLEQVQAILAELPVVAPFEWEGGRETSLPANTQTVWSDYVSTPLECAPFYHSYFLEFEDDREVAPQDVIVEKALADPTAGPNDYRALARVAVRLLDSPDSAMRNVIYRLEAAAPSCADGYVVMSEDLEWEMTNVASLETLPTPASATATDGTVVFVSETGGDGVPGKEVSAWFVVDNLLVSVSYTINDEVPEGSLEGGQQLVDDVIAAFAPAA
jgi:hypothetical protein